MLAIFFSDLMYIWEVEAVTTVYSSSGGYSIGIVLYNG